MLSAISPTVNGTVNLAAVFQPLTVAMTAGAQRITGKDHVDLLFDRAFLNNTISGIEVALEHINRGFEARLEGMGKAQAALLRDEIKAAHMLAVEGIGTYMAEMVNSVERVWGATVPGLAAVCNDTRQRVLALSKTPQGKWRN